MNVLPASGIKRPMAFDRFGHAALNGIHFLLLDAFPVIGTAAAVVGAGLLLISDIR